ncbi:MAG: metallophosphoesterase [Candidatus Hodarchaeota archaeon]
MRILYVTDLHGHKWKYEACWNIIKNYQPEVVINGGDMLPKGGDNLAWQGEFIRDYLDYYFERFNSDAIYYLCYLGNDDLRVLDRLFDEICNKYPFVHNLAQRRIEIDNYEFIGMNFVVDYEFQLKDRCRMDTKDHVFGMQLGTPVVSTPNGWQEIQDWFSYARSLPTIEDELKQLPKPEAMSNTIYVIHMPPHMEGLDIPHHGRDVGSKAVYDFILENQPKLSLHGHIHESPEMTGRWFTRIGNTISIQPGQPKNAFIYVEIDLLEMKFKRARI